MAECCGKHKHTPRSEEMKKDLTTRLNRVMGQINGVKSMVDDDRYCVDVLMQLSAAQSALRVVSDKILAEHMKTCLVEEIKEDNLEVVDEMIKLVSKYK